MNPTGQTIIRKSEWKTPFIERLQEGGSVTAAAESVGINRKTIYEVRKKDPVFADEMDDATSWCIQKAEDTLYTRAIDGQTAELIFFLKCRKPEIYGDKLRSDQIDAIRKEARLQVLSELRSSVQELPEAARQALLAAVPS
jgi:hypothetical protein